MCCLHQGLERIGVSRGKWEEEGSLGGVNKVKAKKGKDRARGERERRE